jgi:hypothetical protein
VGLKPLSPGPGDPGFDVGWWLNEVFHVAEVKSITAANETTQMRLAVGQVLDFAYQARQLGGSVVPVVVAEKQPNERWLTICKEHGIRLAWAGELESSEFPGVGVGDNLEELLGLKPRLPFVDDTVSEADRVVVLSQR